MKVSASVRQVYQEQYERNKPLQVEVDNLLRPIAHRMRWHYESRLKEEISVALKLESGRVHDVNDFEDFFACTIVVQNLSQVAAAEDEVSKLFDLSERRPPIREATEKHADAFPFDDLRIYAIWRDDPALPETGLAGIKFEVQIKTFLQHAWAIATHDLIYKTDEVDWSRQRIAYQVKAMLEHAELSIQEAEALSKSAAMPKVNSGVEEIRQIILFAAETWAAELLPRDRKRLAENIRTACRVLDSKIGDLAQVVSGEVQRNKGVMPSNTSPYGVTVQALIWADENRAKGLLAQKRGRGFIFVTPEMDMPDWVRAGPLARVVLL